MYCKSRLSVPVNLTIVLLLQLEEAVMPYLDALATFREDVRQVARKQKGKCFQFQLMNSYKAL